MNLTAIDVIKTICPSLADSPSLSVYVQIAEESTNCRFFGKLYSQAVAFKACHLYSVYGTDSGITSLGGGAVSGVTEGGLSVQFAVPNDSDNSWNSTKYGKMYLNLLKMRPKMNVNSLIGACPYE